jgi:hypothetical protein
MDALGTNHDHLVLVDHIIMEDFLNPELEKHEENTLFSIGN